jgi:hypothetical protein
MFHLLVSSCFSCCLSSSHSFSVHSGAGRHVVHSRRHRRGRRVLRRYKCKLCDVMIVIVIVIVTMMMMMMMMIMIVIMIVIMSPSKVKMQFV